MKKKFTLALVLTAFAFSVSLWAQTPNGGAAASPASSFVSAPAPGAPNWLHLVLPIAVPIGIGILKRLVPHIPGAWLPLVAPLIGACAGILSNCAGGPQIDPGLAALLGSAGVGVREVFDQANQTLSDSRDMQKKLGQS